MNKILVFIFALLILPSVFAINLDVKKTSSDEVMVLGLDKPAIYTFNITNNDYSDSFLFYTFFGMGLEPVERVLIQGGETKEVELKVYPKADQTTGLNTFKFYIQAKDSSKTEEKVYLKIVDLKDAFEIGSGEFDPTSNSISIYIRNRVNYNFENMNVAFGSAFFTINENFSLAPYEVKTFTINLNKDDFNKLLAGFYTLKADGSVEGKTFSLDGNIKFLEKDIVVTERKDSGLIVSTKIITKENQGNLISGIETTLKKNIFSRLFTTFSPEPTTVDREGFNIYYTWKGTLNPGESSEIRVRTNWLIPVLIILLLVAIVILTKKYSQENLSIRKRVSFVRAKGGEFALKVNINVEARNFVEKVRLVDRLPPLVKIYNQFGGEDPTKISKNSLEWSFGNLEPGEKRMVSYIIYSKVGVLGRFALPTATAFYERDGKSKDSVSNRAFFVTQPSQVDKGEFH